MARDALALIDHLKWSQCHVVGVSMGGMISLEFALLAPSRILSLTLLATHAGGLSGRAPFVGVQHILYSIVARDQEAQIENALAMLYSAKTLSDPEKRKVRKEKICVCSSDHFLSTRLTMIFIRNDLKTVFHRR